MSNKIASQLLDKIKSTVAENPKMTAALLAGAGAGALGGGMLSASNEDPSESKGSRRLRILRNALLTGAAGAGAVGAGALGYKSLANALPKGDVDPATGAVTSVMGRGLMGGALGGIAYRSGKSNRENAARALLSGHHIKTDPGMGQSSLRSILADDGSGVYAKKKLELASDIEGTPKRLIDSGIDPFKHGIGNDYRFSDLFPDAIKNRYQNATDMASIGGTSLVERITNKFPSLEAPVNGALESIGSNRRALSRAMFRHPVVTGMATAGVLAPEVFDAAKTLLHPITPNPFHR